jgi:cell fate (sporulation/competence/biofilm development) regulator YlbF (YheA/YmcA/DUF963 family)
MNEKIRQNAREFASALKETPHVSRYLKAKKKMEDDEDTQKLVKEFQQDQRELAAKQMKGTLNPSEWKAMRNLQIKVINQPLIREYSEAQNEAFEYCRSLGEDLGQLLGVDFGALAAPPSSC